MTAGFLGSNGQEFKTELSSQRVNVDEKLKELNDFLFIFDKNRILKKLKDLSSIRNEVSSLRAPLKID